MKSTNKSILLILLVLCCSAGYSFESGGCNMVTRYECALSEFEKSLVDQIITNHQGVFLRIGDCWIVTEGLQAAQEGVFVLVYGNWMTVEEAMGIPECRRGTWESSRCHFINYEGVSACAVCGKPRHA